MRQQRLARKAKKMFCAEPKAKLCAQKRSCNTSDFTEDHSVHYYLGANELDYAGLMGSGTFSLL